MCTRLSCTIGWQPFPFQRLHIDRGRASFILQLFKPWNIFRLLYSSLKGNKNNPSYFRPLRFHFPFVELSQADILLVFPPHAQLALLFCQTISAGSPRTARWSSAWRNWAELPKQHGRNPFCVWVSLAFYEACEARLSGSEKCGNKGIFIRSSFTLHRNEWLPVTVLLTLKCLPAL